MSITSTEPLLTPQLVAAFHNDGYIVYPRPVLPTEKFAGLKACFEKILADVPTGERPEAMDVPHFIYPELLEWALDDAILDIVEPILGPDLALFSTHFICKPKGNGKRVPWHEDSAYWKSQINPMEVVTVWLALDPSLKENGCMMVLPHTHRTGQKGFSTYADVDASEDRLTLSCARFVASSGRVREVAFRPWGRRVHRRRLHERGSTSGRVVMRPPVEHGPRARGVTFGP